MYFFTFLLYMLAVFRPVREGECSSGDIAIFIILSREKLENGSRTFTVFIYYHNVKQQERLQWSWNQKRAMFYPKYVTYAWRHGKNAGLYRSRVRGHNGSVDLILFRDFINDLPDNVN